VKTAISVPKELFEVADEIARETGTTRSGVFVVALQEYAARRRNRQLREQLDAAYGDGLDEEERDFLEQARREMARLAHEEPW